MLSKDPTTAAEVEKIMKAIYEKIGLDYHTYTTSINQAGVKIVSENK
jgi:homoserine kinase